MLQEHIKQLKNSMPFAVSSSLEVHDVKGRKVRGREYPWGIIETENPVIFNCTMYLKGNNNHIFVGSQ